MSNKHQPPLFYRSFHLTLGGFALILPVFIWIMEGGHSDSWPVKAWILLFVLFIGGACIFLFGVLASDQKIESTRIVATNGNLLVAVLATPMYLVLRGMQRKKREQSPHKKHDGVA
jgi:peptidoglycan/LPS O-acetylase OafA/YrhL